MERIKGKLPYPNSLELRLPNVIPDEGQLGEIVGEARFYLTRGGVAKLLVKDPKRRRFPIATNVCTQEGFIEKVSDYLSQNNLMLADWEWRVSPPFYFSEYSLIGTLHRNVLKG